MTLHLYFTALVAFCVTALLIHALAPVARKIDLVDHPNSRKHHRGAIPLIGGIAIGLGFCIGILALNNSLSTFRALLAGYLLLTVIGILDDFNELSARLRILAQLIIGLLATCWGNILLQNFGNLISNEFIINLGYWAIPLTVIALIALINANNMLDGLNGLAGGSSFMTLACLFWVALRSSSLADAQLLLILLSCVLAFLCFNFPILRYRNRLVFLGDAGSTSLGLMIGWFSIKLTQTPFAFLKPAYLPWLLILPIFDLVTVTLRRLFIKRTSPLTADREHIHHLLQSLNLKNSFVTGILTLLALAGGLTAILMAEYHFSQPLAFSLFLALLFIYFISANFYWIRKNRLLNQQRKNYD